MFLLKGMIHMTSTYRNKVLKEKMPLSTIQEIYKAKEKYVEIEGYKVRSKEDRYLNFIKHGFKCAKCGIEGKYVNLECNSQKGNHLNVYAEKNGEAVLLTKDHIYPKSKGGLDSIKNYQVLCEQCNITKSDNSPIKLVQALREGYATKKSVERVVKLHKPKALIGI